MTKQHDAFRLSSDIHDTLQKVNELTKKRAPYLRLGKGEIVSAALEYYFASDDPDKIAERIIRDRLSPSLKATPDDITRQATRTAHKIANGGRCGVAGFRPSSSQ